MSLAFSHPLSFLCKLDNFMLEKMYDPFMSQVVRRKFGNTNLRKHPTHSYDGIFIVWQYWCFVAKKIIGN